MTLVIRKKISLDFIGEEYKNSYLIFRAIAIDEFRDIEEKIEKADVNKYSSLKMIKDILADHFIEGKVLNDEVHKEDIGQLDAETIMNAFKLLTGQLDPKDKGQSMTQSGETETSQ